MRTHDASGQATAEYAGLLALIAAVLLATGAVAGASSVGDAVAAGLRTGICIVGGDVCRPSDAAAAGLEPCTVGDRTAGGGATVSIAWVRIGDAQGWTVATRSDGSVLVTRTREHKGGGNLGIGLEASPIGLDLGVEGKLDVTVTSGATWEFPDAAAASRFLAGHSHAAPTWRFGQAGEVLTGEAGAKLGGATLSGIEASARAAAGVRVGRGRTTLYIHTRLDSGASVWLPRHAAQVAGPTTGDVLVELTYEHGGFRELAFRTVAPGGERGREVDTMARLDLRDPANRAAAAHLITRRLPWPADVARELHALMLYTVQRGTVERAVYEVRDESHGFELAARLGQELGLQLEDVKVQRRLVAASAWTPGSRERVREDCVT